MNLQVETEPTSFKSSNNPKYFEARPVLLSDRTGELVIIGGEQRTKAAKRLNLQKVPTILFSGLDEQGEDEIMILDNTHAGRWDRAKLDNWQNHLLRKWGMKKEDFKVAKRYKMNLNAILINIMIRIANIPSFLCMMKMRKCS